LVVFPKGGFSTERGLTSAAESLSALFNIQPFASKASSHSFLFSSRHHLWINRQDAAEEKSCIKYELLFA